MNKYIDADKLIAEIKRRKELLTPQKAQGVILCREIIKQFDSLLSFIDTISQLIMKDDIIGEIRKEIERRFSEYNHDSNHHIQAAECASILDFLDTFNIIATLQQEQPKADLEEEIQMEWDSFNYHTAEYGNEQEEVVWLNHNSFWDVAKYFYELGLKARKEE